MNKIKVSFEVQDNWKRGDFREFIQGLLKNDSYEVYIISNDDTTAYILSIGETLGIPNNRVIVTNFTSDKVETIANYNIDVHFDNKQATVIAVDAETDAEAILVDSIPNKYLVEPKYQVEFERVIKKLISGETDNKEVDRCE